MEYYRRALDPEVVNRANSANCDILLCYCYLLGRSQDRAASALGSKLSTAVLVRALLALV